MSSSVTLISLVSPSSVYDEMSVCTCRYFASTFCGPVQGWLHFGEQWVYRLIIIVCYQALSPDSKRKGILPELSYITQLFTRLL